ncbi:hypothetical protein PROVRETT_07237 [Providencia rettgeri DSM 1131]|nr:hypothetical protein PROVRETT_07237 [Providencia rettgeri DSM 1131]
MINNQMNKNSSKSTFKTHLYINFPILELKGYSEFSSMVKY